MQSFDSTCHLGLHLPALHRNVRCHICFLVRRQSVYSRQHETTQIVTTSYVTRKEAAGKREGRGKAFTRPVCQAGLPLHSGMKPAKSVFSIALCGAKGASRQRKSTNDEGKIQKEQKEKTERRGKKERKKESQLRSGNHAK